MATGLYERLRLAASEPSAPVDGPTVVYESEEEMRFGPRRLNAEADALTRRAVADRQPLAEPPLPLD
jgi:hypothetical protein